ncbi:MAG: hypothetical protein A2817_01520 [Candidatus Yanofskybacteria bacterium RIFCSPHIGHO2_01_FULL_39_8b]|uniref:Uncharacterized protein n=1 Tax=Candidatus Yanofskybacteria bacterium RIFCSPHIGHO2_01_FULL_39_8b TaxID=1802659 RepID=A0A1F8E997_9BACT|nr:MAG: hypothetical protein A2817_01520 [Candidatus Yanofskybacteria bacterium RIFCSPHIGHO2_01_FULL_39_8b]
MDLFENFDLWQIPKILAGLSCYAVQLALILFGIWIVYSGISFLLSRGNPLAYGQAKKTFSYSLIGGLVIYGVYTIILSVSAFLGINDLPLVPLTCL